MDHLTVSGDVTFGRGVSLRVCVSLLFFVSFSLSLLRLKTESYLICCNLLFQYKHTQGTVIIIANHGDRIDIPAGAILENKIVSGNMRILDH